LNNPTILTAGGRYFPFDDPESFDFDIDDIAHGLSHICRFTGHTRKFYSVAQHSVHVSELVPPALRLEALLHDASEAYLGDVSSPLKSMLPTYKDIEHRTEHAIARVFGLVFPLPPEIKQADLRMLVTEKRDLMPTVQYDSVCWPTHKPAPFKVAAMSPEHARNYFLDKYRQYVSERMSHAPR